MLAGPTTYSREVEYTVCGEVQVLLKLEPFLPMLTEGFEAVVEVSRNESQEGSSRNTAVNVDSPARIDMLQTAWLDPQNESELFSKLFGQRGPPGQPLLLYLLSLPDRKLVGVYYTLLLEAGMLVQHVYSPGSLVEPIEVGEQLL